ncbi:hypothetical protein CEE86_04300 [Lactobacillus crispatus]|uniref:isopeptide-forming domain-containing fimbrial protein n=1 Tax=Lactobacillus crispatus TaxID=47770 RepID=UPI00105F983C|nr:isopeptide-forming domain-containing fimbrial protein [Lactobacillus crispatus]TDN05872.1 hypothetical protein CEE86_04300 [Lactobacillus crispatus]
MKKLSKKQTRELLSALGVVTTLGSVGVGVAVANHNANPNIVKADAAADVKYVSDATFKKGSDIAFDIYYQVPYNTDLKKLVLFDKLEPVFTHNKTRVFDGNTDVTDQFTADFDKGTNTTNMTAKKPQDWVGKKLSMRIETTLQKNANLDRYLDKNTNQYNIPNVGQMIYNDEKIKTPPVYVHTPNDEEPTAIKQVEDKNGQYGEKAKHDAGDEFHYRVQYSIPENGKDISNVVFYDDLEKVLDLEDVKITDDKGNEVTKEGDLKLDKDKESFTWQPSKEYLTQMPKHIYTADITVKLKTDADLSGYLNKATKNYEIPNVAHMKYNNKDIPSNPVKVETPPPAENKVVKSVQGLSGSYHEDKDNVEVGKDYTYKIDYTAGEGQHLTDVEFTDKLEDVLDLEKVVVKNADGKDITTEQGTLKLDEKNESFNWQPNADLVKIMPGKKYTVEVTAKVKDNADLQKYIKNNTIEIPNTAHFKANGKDTPSNTPVVTPKVEEPKTHKGIVKNPSDWAKFFGNKSETSSGQQSDSDAALPKTYQKAQEYVKVDPNTGIWSKANDKVTDEQYAEAVKILQKPFSNPNAGKEATSSDVATKAPTSKEDLKQIISASTVDSNQASRGDALDYLLTFDIGNSQAMKSLVLSDDLENVLDLKNVVIIDSDGNNITNQGKLTTSDQDESFTWSANDPAKFSRKIIYVAIAANIKPNADVTSYDNNGIPNTGHMQINGQDTPTNVVHTTLNGDPKNPEKTTPDPKKEEPTPENGKKPDPFGNLVTKQVKAESGQWGESDKVKQDEDFSYKVDYTVGNKQDVKSVEFTDDLEDVLDLEKVKITDDQGNDITNDGELKLDDNTEKFSWKPNQSLVGKMGGKKYTANITAKLKKDSKVNGEIPNTADMKVNNDDVKSNTVNVIPPQEDKESPSNVDNPKNPTTNSTNNPDNPNNPANPSNNPITGKNGFLPRTGHFILQHAGWIIASLVAMAGGIGTYLYKTNDEFKNKIKGLITKITK